MLQESILYKIFLRYLKEKNMSTQFFKCNVNKYLSRIEKNIRNDASGDLLYIFSLSYYSMSKNTDDYRYNEFCGNWSNNIEFNLIILYAMKPYVKDFLKKEGVLKSFLKNLCEYNSHVQSLNIEENSIIKNSVLKPFLKNLCEYNSHIQSLNIEKNSIIKNTDLILDTYIDYLASQRESIFRFINRAFNFWRVGNTDLWHELNKKFNDYIIEKLLSKYKRKKVPYLKRLFIRIQKNVISLIKQKR